MLSKRSVFLPPGFPVGAIFGKGGSNIKRLREQSGSRSVWVDAQALRIDIIGNPAACSKAEAMLQEQFDAHARSEVTAYPHPAHAFTLVAPQIATCSYFKAVPGHDEVAKSTGRPETMHYLSPKDGRTASAYDDEVDDIIHGVQSASLSTSSQVTFYPIASLDSKVHLLVQAQQLAAAHHVPFDDIKLRVNLGKQFFYHVRNGRCPSLMGAMNLSKLQGLQVGRDIKSVYSNSVRAHSAAHLHSALTTTLGFSLLHTRKTISAHINRHRGHTSVCVSYLRTGSTLTVRKVKTGQEKLFFLSLVNGSSAPDARCKLVAQRKFDEASTAGAEAWSVARGCSYNGGSTLQLAAAYCGQYEIDALRFKDKTTYTATRQVSTPSGAKPCTLRVTVSSVRGDSSHTEVSVACPEFDIRGVNAGGKDARAVDAAAAAAYVLEVLGLCRELRAHL